MSLVTCVERCSLHMASGSECCCCDEDRRALAGRWWVDWCLAGLYAEVVAARPMSACIGRRLRVPWSWRSGVAFEGRAAAPRAGTGVRRANQQENGTFAPAEVVQPPAFGEPAHDHHHAQPGQQPDELVQVGQCGLPVGVSRVGGFTVRRHVPRDDVPADVGSRIQSGLPAQAPEPSGGLVVVVRADDPAAASAEEAGPGDSSWNRIRLCTPPRSGSAQGTSRPSCRMRTGHEVAARPRVRPRPPP